MVDWSERREARIRRPEDSRTDSQVDYARVVHSASFRRLQGKTQILNLGDSDFYRTRLTHSLEVAQVARGIVQRFDDALASHPAISYLPDTDMVQAIGFTHDLGHPPFGHGGEVALNFCMRDAGGFEGNGQTLRILGRLEKFSESFGANLTRRTMLGVLKYPVPFSRVHNPDRKPALVQETSAVKILDRDRSKPPKAYMDCDQDIVDWILRDLSDADRELFTAVSDEKGKHGKSAHKSFDCSIMDLADDISFGVHDLEDAIAMGMISHEAFVSHVPAETCAPLIKRMSGLLGSGGADEHYSDLVAGLFGGERARKQAIGLLVNHFITEAEISEVGKFDEPLLRYRAGLPEAPREFLNALIKAVRAEVIYSASVQQLEFKGQAMVVAVFEALACDPLKLLPEATRSRYREAANESAQLRVICDHIAGMTDSFLLKTYERLFSPRMGSVFDRL